jgi:hypothetical protein
MCQANYKAKDNYSFSKIRIHLKYNATFEPQSALKQKQIKQMLLSQLR